MIQVTAVIQQRGTGARDEGPGESREITVSADSYADAKRSILEQLPNGWIIGSFRVSSGSRR